MTTIIPKNHPRRKSLLIREKLSNGFNSGIVAYEGLMAHGRGEAFDYLLGEKTTKNAKNAIRAAASTLLLAKSPVISVNGNTAALCHKEIIELAKITNSKIEINLFYYSERRKHKIYDILKRSGAHEILGIKKKSIKHIKCISSMRRIVDSNGIYSSDVVLVPLEDGDRCIKLKNIGKTIITFDLNPFSRTSQTADITIIDNIVRGIVYLIKISKRLSTRNKKYLENIKESFDNKNNISESVIQINKNLMKTVDE